MKTFKFSLVLRTRENTDVFITLDDNIYGIHSKRVNILYLVTSQVVTPTYSCAFYIKWVCLVLTVLATCIKRKDKLYNETVVDY